LHAFFSTRIFKEHHHVPHDYGQRYTLESRRALYAKLGRIAMPVMGAVLIAASPFLLSGLDRIVETAVTNAMPNCLVSLGTGLAQDPRPVTMAFLAIFALFGAVWIYFRMRMAAV